MAGPKISQQSILVPGVPKVSDAHASGQPKNVKENVVHQSRPPSSIAPWSSPDAHMWCSHCWCFQQWSAVAWAPRPRCGYAAPIHGDFSYLSIRKPQMSHSCSSVLSDHTGSLCSPHASASLDPATGSSLFLPWTTFYRCYPLQTGTTPQICTFLI